MRSPVTPLGRIRVLDLSRHIAGPVAVNVLRQLGAEVVRIEPPDGSDPGRRGVGLHPGSEHNPMYYALHRGKRSLAVDLKNPAGRRLVLDLAAHCDVLVENLRPGAMAALGLGWEQVREVSPRLVYCSVTGFGTTGPLADAAVTDGAIQAFGGVMYVNAGSEDGAPGPLTVINVADVSGGLYAAHAILAGLIGRQQTGAGCRIDMSLFEPLLQLLPREVSEKLAGRQHQQPGAILGPALPALMCSDGGHVVVQLPYPPMQERFRRLAAQTGGVPELLDERFGTPQSRVANATEYVPLVERAFLARSQAEWVADLRALQIPSGPVKTLGDALASEQLRIRGGVVEVESPVGGTVPALGNPFHFEGLDADLGVTPPPYVGEHSEEILRGVLGYDDAQVEAVRTSGALEAGVGDGA